tara:strand:+ start:114 stop:491 length:378 start_codon:yes stop_codon:yes gene_type:complete
MGFKMKGSPMARNYGAAFKDAGHGGEDFHMHKTKPTEGAPTAKPGGISQEAINKMAAANKAAAESPSNEGARSRGERKTRSSGGSKRKRARNTRQTARKNRRRTSSNRSGAGSGCEKTGSCGAFD